MDLKFNNNDRMHIGKDSFTFWAGEWRREPENRFQWRKFHSLTFWDFSKPEEKVEAPKSAPIKVAVEVDTGQLDAAIAKADDLKKRMEALGAKDVVVYPKFLEQSMAAERQMAEYRRKIEQDYPGGKWVGDSYEISQSSLKDSKGGLFDHLWNLVGGAARQSGKTDFALRNFIEHIRAGKNVAYMTTGFNGEMITVGNLKYRDTFPMIVAKDDTPILPAYAPSPPGVNEYVFNWQGQRVGTVINNTVYPGGGYEFNAVKTASPRYVADLRGQSFRWGWGGENWIRDRFMPCPAKPQPEVTEGSIWRHYNGNKYRVLFLTNKVVQNKGHPVDVVYENASGKVKRKYSRPLSDWHRSFTFVSNPVLPPHHINCRAEFNVPLRFRGEPNIPFAEYGQPHHPITATPDVRPGLKPVVGSVWRRRTTATRYSVVLVTSNEKNTQVILRVANGSNGLAYSCPLKEFYTRFEFHSHR